MRLPQAARMRSPLRWRWVWGDQSVQKYQPGNQKPRRVAIDDDADDGAVDPSASRTYPLTGEQKHGRRNDADEENENCNR
jgi:hypothetical protein